MTEQVSEQHVYHHTDNNGPRINVKLESNSRGMNWEVTVIGTSTVDEAIALLQEAVAKIKSQLDNA